MADRKDRAWRDLALRASERQSGLNRVWSCPSSPIAATLAATVEDWLTR